MAQTGYTPISLFYSSTASNAPSAGSLVAGELAINTADGKLFYKDSSNAVQVLATKSTGSIGGSTTQVQYNLSGSLAGSANLTFDGTNLTTAGSETAARFIPTGSTVATNGMYLPAANILGFSINSTEIMRITSRGLGIGTNSITSKLTIGTDSFTSAAANTTGMYTGANGLIVLSDGFILATRSGGDLLNVNTSGGLQVLNTIGVGNTTPSTSGAGITFPATQSASSDANTLDDYEEGTWTPTITFGAASTGITYSLNEGCYTKIGNQVFFTGVIQLSSKGSATGYADIRGFPFTVQNANGAISAASMRFVNISFSGAFQGVAPINSTLISLTQISILGSVTDLTDTNFSNNSSITFSINYRV